MSNRVPTGVAVMRVSSEVLRQLMHLPDDCDVLGSLDSDDMTTVDLLIEHESIPQEATMVEGMFRSVRGVSVFDRFEVVRKREDRGEFKSL